MDSVNEALVTCVKACGGSKQVADLQRQFVAATQTMAAMVQRMEQLQPSVTSPHLRAA